MHTFMWPAVQVVTGIFLFGWILLGGIFNLYHPPYLPLTGSKAVVVNSSIAVLILLFLLNIGGYGRATAPIGFCALMAVLGILGLMRLRLSRP
jgi:hypothetical protein